MLGHFKKQQIKSRGTKSAKFTPSTIPNNPKVNDEMKSRQKWACEKGLKRSHCLLSAYWCGFSSKLDSGQGLPSMVCRDTPSSCAMMAFTLGAQYWPWHHPMPARVRFRTCCVFSTYSKNTREHRNQNDKFLVSV
jgi:hypothetical protein